MHANRFDQLVREWSTPGTRRGLLRVLMGAPVIGLLVAGRAAGSEAGRRRRARHRARGDKNRRGVNDQGKKSKRNDKGKRTKDKKKDASSCAKAGQTPRRGKRCCQGLVKDETGRCASTPPAPTRPGCATTCSGCCIGETCITSRTNATCGTGGVPCAPCTPPQTCGGGPVPGICGCTPRTTCPAPLDCDSIDNGCGTGTIDCGDCTGSDTCGGGTPPTPNVCGCTPTCPDNACGNTDDGCGSTISCSTCENPTPICAGGNPCAACADSAQCGPHHLCRNGSCFACTVCDDPVACEASLQAAIDLALAGDTIYICPGVYNETITIDKNLTLIGAGSGLGAGNTVLDALEAGRVVTIGSGHDVTLQSMRFTGGSVSGGSEDGDGGGIYTVASTLTMAGCVVVDNSASRGSGIFNSDGALSLENCDVLENTATGNGGGIYTQLGSITLDASHVRGINTANLGGGIYSDSGTVTLLNNSTVTDNDAIAASPPAQGSGGGIFNSGGTVVIEAGSDVALNRPDNCVGC